MMIQVSCYKVFSEGFGEKKNKWIKDSILFISLYLGIVCAVFYFDGSQVLKGIVCICIYSAYAKLHLEVKEMNAVVLAILFYSLAMIIDFSIYVLIAKQLNSVGYVKSSDEIVGRILILLGKIILLVCIILIRGMFSGKRNLQLSIKEWIKIALVSGFTLMSIIMIIINKDYVVSVKNSNILFFTVLILVLSDVVLFSFINDILSREKQLKEAFAINQSKENQIKKFMLQTENFETQRKLTHDYKNNINYIESLLDENNYDELRKYVRKLSDNIKVNTKVVNSYNEVVDRILNIENAKAEIHGITMIMKIGDLSELNMSDDDLNIILFNLIDNAIEACRNNDHNKNIKIKMLLENGNMILSVSNKYERELNYENNQLVTTKTDKSVQHGVGVKNVISVVQKHKGFYNIDTSGGEFVFTIMIPQ